MLRYVFTKSLWDQRRSLTWWSVGIAALAILTTRFYPSISGAGDLGKALENLFSGGFTDLNSPEGFLNSQRYSLTVPIVFLIFAISAGSGAIAGEEERGTLDLLMSSPVTRSEVLVNKFAAMTVAISVLGAVLWARVALGAAIVDMDLSRWRSAQVVASGLLQRTAFGACALALGSATGRRGTSIAVASTAAVGTYFLNALAPLVDVLDPLTKLSPFHSSINLVPLLRRCLGSFVPSELPEQKSATRREEQLRYGDSLALSRRLVGCGYDP